MIMGRYHYKKFLLGLALFATCSTVLASFANNDKRRNEEESSQDKVHPRTHGSFKSSTSKNNEISAEPGKKVTHRLIGGHLRIDSKRDETLWDDGILMSSAGNGKERKSSREDDDDKKTLSQQVKEGKYGLIQNEIYKDRPKRPGIISYLGNPEVPKDTVENLGGLDEDEIWLAENHVLVLRGGKFPERENAERNSSVKWPPIDDYKAPRRQVKIPARPKIPPPFPVQLTEGGPVQVIGSNSQDPKAEKIPFFTISPNGTLIAPDYEDSANSTKVEGSPKNLQEKKTKSSEEPPNAGPFFPALPPGAVFVPPPSNSTDYDEEDQSIYYPPPYSFQFDQDNTTAVPPGPLVPGIILPPPPDFFSSLEDKKTTVKGKHKQTTTPLPRTRPTYLPPRKFSIKPFKPSTSRTTTTTHVPKTAFPVIKLSPKAQISNDTKPSRQKVATHSYERTLPLIEVTTSVPVTTTSPLKPTTLENSDYFTVAPLVGNQVVESSTSEKSRWSDVASKPVSVVSYYAPTTPTALDPPVEVTPASVKKIIATKQPERLPNQASYYFYEEASDATVSTEKPAIYYRTTTESPFYKLAPVPVQQEDKKQYYSVETIPAPEKEYNVKLLNALSKDPQIHEYTESAEDTTSPKYHTESPRVQGQRMLSDSAPVYYQTITSRPPVTLRSYYTTPKTQTYYRDSEEDRHKYSRKPKPIYQFSYESADYARKKENQPLYKQPTQQETYDEYQDIQNDSENYNYDTSDAVPKQQLHVQERVTYKTQPVIYTSTTDRPDDTTANPEHAYFTHQDEKLLDEVTKEYFTIFGKKLTGKSPIQSTTPIYAKNTNPTETPRLSFKTFVSNEFTGQSAFKLPKVKVHYGDHAQKSYSLKDDTLVNYKRPLPPINPDSEFIVVDPKHQAQPMDDYRREPLIPSRYYGRENFGNQRFAPIRGYGSQRLLQPSNRPQNNFAPMSGQRNQGQRPYRPVSLHDDIAINFQNPRPTINPDAEFIGPMNGQSSRLTGPTSKSAYFAYNLPGDSGHFYFLTPQSIGQRQEPQSDYMYSKPRSSRLLRRRSGPA